MASPVLEFTARPSDSLPSFIAPFAHPVHALRDVNPEENVDNIHGSEWRETNGIIARALGGSCCESLVSGLDQHSTDLEYSV